MISIGLNLGGGATGALCHDEPSAASYADRSNPAFLLSGMSLDVGSARSAAVVGGAAGELACPWGYE